MNDSFDIVVAFQFIEHLPPQKLKTFFQEIQRILKADGLFFLTTPNRKFRLRPFQLPFNLEHYKEFTAKELLQILVPIFNDVKIHGIRGKEWIEKIEKERLQISFFKAYFYYPFARFVYKVFPNFSLLFK
ncbi:methyltransferase domain-containing protein, partial [Candidatus Parcubacteria bacterium]|nr:methyltransferase domain-containing protein [Candidatus Parcubacteria bacterium]